jgi:hypothetical protein
MYTKQTKTKKQTNKQTKTTDLAHDTFGNLGYYLG